MMVFGPSERDVRELDGIMGSVDPGDVDEIRRHDDGRVVVVLAPRR